VQGADDIGHTRRTYLPQAAQQQLWEQLGALRAQAESAQASAAAVCDQLEQKADWAQVSEQLAHKAGRADLEAGLALKVDVHTYLATSAAQAKALGAAGMAARAAATGGQQGQGQGQGGAGKGRGLSSSPTAAAGAAEGRADDGLIRAVYAQLQSLPPPAGEGLGPAAAAAGAVVEGGEPAAAIGAWLRDTGAGGTGGGAPLQLVGRSGSSQGLGGRLPQFSRFHPALDAGTPAAQRGSP
jgi:hypothetical protein